jgi:hypothetical protein
MILATQRRQRVVHDRGKLAVHVRREPVPRAHGIAQCRPASRATQTGRSARRSRRRSRQRGPGASRPRTPARGSWGEEVRACSEIDTGSTGDNSANTKENAGKKQTNKTKKKTRINMDDVSVGWLTWDQRPLFCSCVVGAWIISGMLLLPSGTTK